MKLSYLLLTISKEYDFKKHLITLLLNYSTQYISLFSNICISYVTSWILLGQKREFLEIIHILIYIRSLPLDEDSRL